MKRKSPISVDGIRFYAYGCDRSDELVFIDQFPYDDRHDFLADEHLGGIAVKVAVSNNRYDRGARRSLVFTLVDMTMRCELARQHVRVCLGAGGFKDGYIHFPAETSGLVAGHDYKLLVADETLGETLTESIIHLLDKSVMGNPEDWYEVTDGGIRPGWENHLYRSLNTVDGHEYLVQFNVAPTMCCKLPSVMPELEIRLYYPDGKTVKDYFREPRCYSQENYADSRWTVECPFETVADINGVFYAELLCMEYPVAGFVFDTMSADNVSGRWYGAEILPMDDYSPSAARKLLDAYLSDCNESDSLDEVIDRFIASQHEAAAPDEDAADSNDAAAPAPAPEDEPVISLDYLTGLRSVKEKLARYERVVRFNKMRTDRGLPVSATPLHAMFLGSPGTGKTTVAGMMGALLRRAGVLSKGHVVVRERATLLGQNYHSESEKTLAAIEEAQGGILFIDEAYQLYQANDPRDPGRFVIETLLTALADDANRDWMLVLAGYPDEMKRMFDLNPGFRSRIPDSNIYTFDDFSESELMEIAENYLARNNYTLSPAARQALAARLNADYDRRDRNFGNARHVMNMIQTEILPSMAVRVINDGLDDEASLTEIQAADIPAPAAQTSPSRPRVGFSL